MKKKDGTAEVNEFMQKLDHPFTAEVQAVRDIIKGVNKEITEEVKWNAPSFKHTDYIVTFNLWERKRIHLVFHNPQVSKVKSKLLQGDYDTRRMAYFADMQEVKAKKAELEKVVKELIALMDIQAKKGTSMTASEQIDAYIAGITDWRGKLLARLRKLILSADSKMTEEWKWGSPVWSHNGLVCSASAFKDHVKVNFFQGAALADPQKLFNAGLDAKKTRAIDFQDGDKLNDAALKKLVRAAVAQNASK